MKSKTIFWLNVVFITAIFVLNYFYQRVDFDFTLKCITSSVFALLGVTNLSYSLFIKAEHGRGYSLAMTAGLILAFLGDVFIVFNFIAGAALFALAHICFVCSYAYIRRFCRGDFILGAFIFALTFAFLNLYPYFDFSSVLIKLVCIFYGFIISFMLGKAIYNFISGKSILNFTVFIASVLFYFSDLMLVLGRFANAGQWASHLCMATYYPAVSLLALSVYINIKNNS